MYEQLSIFSFLEDAPKQVFSWDEDTNEIHRRLHDLADKYKLTVEEEEWEIWSHVPQFGYRMSVYIKVTREVMKNDQFFADIDVIVDYAKSKNIELSPMYGATFFYLDDNIASLAFYSTFLDKARKKRKNW